MLKIRDDIDLKELEKFGFEKIEKEFYRKRIGDKVKCYCYLDDKSISLDITEIGSLQISLVNSIDIIYDLIQAGLVEKVEE